MKKKYLEYNKGDSIGGNKITKIYGYSNNFILYEINNNGGVQYQITGIDRDILTPIKPLAMEILGLITTKNEGRKFSTRIASAYMDCFSGNSEVALEVLRKVKNSIIKHKKINAKLYYLTTCIILVIVNIITSYFVNTIFSSYLPSYCVLLFTIAAFGSLGGFLSISININKLDLDIDGGLNVQILTGFSRIFISMISSLIIFTIIKSNLMLGIINEVNNNHIFYALAVVSGFSETFVPNVIKSIEKEKTPS